MILNSHTCRKKERKERKKERKERKERKKGKKGKKGRKKEKKERKKDRKKERKNIYKEKGLEVEREGSAMGQKLITSGKNIKRFDSEMLVATCLRTIVNIGSKRQRNYGVFPVVHTNPFLLPWWW